jgi:hypothetical protein
LLVGEAAELIILTVDLRAEEVQVVIDLRFKENHQAEELMLKT